MQRRKIWWEILHPTWGWLVLTPFAILSAVQAVRDEYLAPEVAAHYRLPEILPKWEWERWALVTATLLVVLLLESAYRAIRKREIEIAALRGDLAPVLSFSYEFTEPWVGETDKAQVPRNDSVIVLAHAKWFCVELSVNSTASQAYNCRVYLKSVEHLRNGVFEPTNYRGNQQLRWAEENEAPFDAKRITAAQRVWVDVFSIDEVHNTVFPKWRPIPWLRNQNLFGNRGVYRLIVTAEADNAPYTEVRLVLLWPGAWDKAEMYQESLKPAPAAAVRFNAMEEAS
jgi:hypothetical protein